MRILLTNDDGIYAPGIAAFREAVSGMGEVTVIAPDMERSAVGHSITLDRPLRVREIYTGDVFLGYAVDGSPADCVKIGVNEILDHTPDLILSGINLGNNVGINVLYSGTVAAALEGTILGITSAAVSLESTKRPDFASAGKTAAGVISKILSASPPGGSLFNINLPAIAPDALKGTVFARQSTVSYDNGFDLRTDPRGGSYFWMTGELQDARVEPDTDTAYLRQGYVTITPLQSDLTDAGLLAIARNWDLDRTE